MTTPLPPALLPPPAALVIDGRHQLGSFDGPVPQLNLGDIVQTPGWRGRMANWGRDFRTKEWEAFQLGNDEWFVLGAVYNAKVVGIVMVIAVHQASGRRLRWINKVPARSVEVARGLERSVSRGGSRRSALTITNALADGRIDLDGHHAGRNSLPSMSLTGTGLIDEDTRHLAVCHPFPSDRILYTNKVLVPFTGVLSIGEETITFDEDRSFLILDDHHGEYPSPQIYDWVTGARHEGGSLLGFNLTRNQALNPEVNNENVLWRDGGLHRLPAVTFDRPDGVEGPWHISDRDGLVEVTFTPEVPSTLHVGPRHSLAEYHAPYGRFQGQITAAGRTTSLDGIFGMGEKKKIRL